MSYQRRSQPRSYSNEHIEYPVESRHQIAYYDDNRERGLARDYYDGHPLAPAPTREEKDQSRRGRSSRGRSHSVSANYRRGSSPDPDRRRTSSQSRKRQNEGKWAQAATSALVAGAVEAFRLRHEPGKWAGAKGARIATAAIGAAAIDAGLDRDPKRHQKRHVAEATIGGLILDRLANGPRDRGQSKSRH
jgi:hypothetical protein